MTKDQCQIIYFSKNYNRTNFGEIFLSDDHPCTMGTLCSKRVDKLETMFFWAFQAYSTALYDFKWVFCKKKILVVPQMFKILN